MNNLYFFKREDSTAELYDDFSYAKKGFLSPQINESAILLFSLDTNGTVTLLEGKILDMLGIERAEMLGASIFDAHRKKIPIFENIKEAITNKLSSTIFEHKDYIFQIYYTSMRDLNGGINGITGVAIDITEQKRADKEIKKKNEQISLLYESGKMLGRTLELKVIYHTLMDIITKVADCDTLFVCSYDEVQKLIKYDFLMDKNVNEEVDTSKIPPIPLAPSGYGIISNAIRSGDAIIINDYQEQFKKVKISFNISTKTESTNLPESPQSVGSALIVPITTDKKILGVIQIFSKKKNAYSKGQLSFIKALMQPIGLAINNALLYQSAQSEIGERKAAEIKINRSLVEKELLLKEIHHRVKNNLQIVKSLLNVQSRYIKDNRLLKYFNESRDRIQSIALIHELLYKGQDITMINFPEYIKRLSSYLFDSFGIANDQISLNINAIDVSLSIDIAIPCGLLINELVSNSLKHGFPEGRKGNIDVSLELTGEDPGKYILRIRDNGIGFPAGYDVDSDFESLGLKIVRNLTGQLDGTIKFEADNGTLVEISFPPSNYMQRI
jgi:PAS domain S-box-containing protein